MYKSPFLAAILFTIQSIQASEPLAHFNSEMPFLLYYGNWNSSQIQQARDNYRLVILEPSSNITDANIQTIQSGPDGIEGTSDDVIVLGYISLGEDPRPSAPVVGDGTGPRIDPRVDPLNDPIRTVVEHNLNLGAPSPGGSGFASYYLDSNNDGQPDRNSIFGAYYVNPGNPEWMNVIKSMTRSSDARSGLDEILTSSAGAGLAMDGIFVDTVDTAAPNSFGGTQYEWTAPYFTEALGTIENQYPNKIIFLNRALFYFHPAFEHYEFNPRPHIDALLFESYYTDSVDTNIISPFFDFNKHIYAPRLNVEASLADGFTIFALGYDNPTNIPQSVKDQDFVESQQIQGWPLYRSVITLDQIRTDANTWSASNPDSDPPQWDSSAALSEDSDFSIAGNQPPTPRSGIQAARGGNGTVTVFWDISRDQTNPIRYNVYYQEGNTLDFSTATVIHDVQPELNPTYAGRLGSSVFPFKYDVTGLSNRSVYTFAIRAQDSSSGALEESNTMTVQAIPNGTGNFKTIAIDGDFTDWETIPMRAIDPIGDEKSGLNDLVALRMANDENFLYIRLDSASGSSWFTNARNSVYLDTDADAVTGFASSTGLGAEVLIQSSIAYDQRDGLFASASLPDLTVVSAVSNDGLFIEFSLPRHATYSGNSPMGVAPVFSNSELHIGFTSDQSDFSTGEIFPLLGATYIFAASRTPGEWLMLE